MNKHVFQSRYKEYCDALIGKQYGDQYLNIFEQKFDDSKYSNIFLENDIYWIINITKTVIEKHYFTQNPFIRNRGIFLHNMYLHKDRDFAVLKSNIIQLMHASNRNANYNIKRYIGFRLKQLGYNFFKFAEKIVYQNDTSTILVKILIPQDKLGEDIVKLLMIIDKINDFIINNPPSYWDDTVSVFNNVKIE